MVSLMESVGGLCPDLPRSLIVRHFDSLPAAYFERYSVAEIVRHLRLLANVPSTMVEVEIQPLGAHTFEVVVAGTDNSGTLACITVSLAALGFSLEDVQVSTYLENDPATENHALPRSFIILLRVSGSLRGQTLLEFTETFRERLRQAFSHLAQGNLLAAQSAAADVSLGPSDRTFPTPQRLGANRHPAGYEGMILGGDFKLQQKLGSGGICEVYQAVQLSLNRTVAVKLFLHEGPADADLFTRFNQEAVVLAQFNCPHVVQILAAGTSPALSGGSLGWMAMEYMAGGDLAQFLHQKGSPPTDLGVPWFRDALEGLAYAHRRGVLHRDLKPHNLLLTADGAVKVSDFGLLKQVQQPASGLTPRSTIIGTPHYMSPEQALGESLDERSDIFSLGTSFFHIFSGKLPFERAGSSAAVLVQISQENAPRLDAVAPHVPLPLVTLISRMMARRREERYQEVSVILEDLASYERRGLLHCSEERAFGMAPPAARLNADQGTEAFLPPPGEMASR